MVNTCINYNLNVWHVVNFFHILSFVMSGIFQVHFGAEFWPHSQCKNDQYFPQKWLKIPNLKFLSESEPSSSNTCFRPSYPQIMKVIPKLTITSNSSILYFLYGARSYAEELNHLKYNFVELKIRNFTKMSRIFPISWTLDPDQNTMKIPGCISMSNWCRRTGKFFIFA